MGKAVQVVACCSGVSEAYVVALPYRGPGSDSMIGLFQELGPCNISEDLQSNLNPYSWTEYSNMVSRFKGFHV